MPPSVILFLPLQAEEARQLEELQCSEEPPSLPPPPPPELVAATSCDNPDSPAEGDEDGVRPHEASQVDEILRLEREIQALQRQKERQELSLTEASLNRLQLLRDQELRRLEDEACRAAQQFLDSLNFDEIDECVRNIETSLGGVGEGEEEKEGEKREGGGHPRRHEDEEVDEGFGADDDAFKDSPNPSEHGHSDGQRTSGIRTSDDSSEEDPYANEGMGAPLPPPLPPPNLLLLLPPVPPACLTAPCGPSDAQSDHLVELIPPDEDSDYDQDDYDEGAMMPGGSVAFSGPRSGQWSPDYRGSVGTYSSSGAYRFSSEGPQSSVSSHWGSDRALNNAFFFFCSQCV